MYILGDDWSDGYLDYHRSDRELRIRVRCWMPVARVEDVFVVQPRSIRRILNYVQEVGVANVVRKIRSRMKENLRNRRVIAVGLGDILETCDAADWPVGTPVVFVAPCHPDCVERVVLPPALVEKVAPELIAMLSGDGIRLLPMANAPEQAISSISGWSIHSGTDPSAHVNGALQWAKSYFSGSNAAAGRVLPLSPPSKVEERRERSDRTGSAEKTAVLFGLGHYAKICVLPHLDPRIRVTVIHELEPTQLGRIADGGCAYDACHHPRAGQRADVFLIAGYHHTHGPLAVHSLRAGGWAVVEKPLVTTRDQLDDLLAVVREHPGRLFGCFQMRYNEIWNLAREDLALSPGEPVNYNCIVFEIKLGRLHWYHWPVSRSRLVSNGCHWLDHFLFMNDYSPPMHRHALKASNGDVHVSVELENGASFSMVLTDIGSPRIGVQDHIQLRARDVTVRVDNGWRYVSENSQRVIRRAKGDKPGVYARMYGTISRRILAGEPGDSIESIQRSCELMLDLEDMI